MYTRNCNKMGITYQQGNRSGCGLGLVGSTILANSHLNQNSKGADMLQDKILGLSIRGWVNPKPNLTGPKNGWARQIEFKTGLGLGPNIRYEIILGWAWVQVFSSRSLTHLENLQIYVQPEAWPETWKPNIYIDHWIKSNPRVIIHSLWPNPNFFTPFLTLTPSLYPVGKKLGENESRENCVNGTRVRAHQR